MAEEQAQKTPEELKAEQAALLAAAWAKYEADLAEARISGRPFGTEHPLGGVSRVVYLTQDEVDDAADRTAQERSERGAADARARLREIDSATVRALRERSLGKGDVADSAGKTANQVLMELEDRASAERAKLEAQK